MAIVKFKNIVEAHERIKEIAHKTTVLSSRRLNELTGKNLFFKCENLQRGGAFKFRGAFNFLTKLAQEDPDLKKKGVIAFSSGNHAQGLALAAKTLGVPALIVMPQDAPRKKLDATKEYGAEIKLYDRYSESREEIAAAIAKERGSYLIPPFDHPNIIEGQGTVAKEFLEEVPELDALFIPAGGGGLLSGCSIAAKSMKENIKIFGVEPESGNDWQLSIKAGKRIKLENHPNTIADGLMHKIPGKLTFPIVKKFVDGILLVSESEITDMIKKFMNYMKLVVEPSGAVAAAAVLNAKYGDQLSNNQKNIGIIVSGGNIDDEVLAKILS